MLRSGALLTILICWPFEAVVTEIVHHNPWPLAKSLPAGEFFKIESADKLDYAAIDGRALNVEFNDEGPKVYSGVMPFYKADQAQVWALTTGKNNQVILAKQTIDVWRPQPKKISQLRIAEPLSRKLAQVDPILREIERHRHQEAISLETPQLTAHECWRLPLNQVKITSQFGSPRTPPNGSIYYHSGLDLRAAPGTAVYASRSGHVRDVGEMTYTGRLVVLDHGAGYFTRYLHLQETSVQLGEWVKQGQLIGLSGQTGRVEAPHLHWEVLWRGQNANPLTLHQHSQKHCQNSELN